MASDECTQIYHRKRHSCRGRGASKEFPYWLSDDHQIVNMMLRHPDIDLMSTEADDQCLEQAKLNFMDLSGEAHTYFTHLN